jgi:DNA-directed RNA polymerase subunit RPC12/RpoP
MDKTVCKNWELNYKCVDGCGMNYYNMTHELYRCEECGGKLKEVNPLKSREKKYGKKRKVQ